MDNDHPDPEVQERAKRRIFSLSYKTNILRITDDLPRGEIAGFLRKEALYWAQLQTWRKQREDGTLGEPKKRGRKAAGAEASNAQLAQLRRENARLQRKLQKAEKIIALQKKVAEILGDDDLPESEF